MRNAQKYVLLIFAFAFGFALGAELSIRAGVVAFAIGYLLIFLVGVVFTKHRLSLGGIDSCLAILSIGVFAQLFSPLSTHYLSFPFSEYVASFMVGGLFSIGGFWAYFLTIDKGHEASDYKEIIDDTPVRLEDVFSKSTHGQISGASENDFLQVEQNLGIQIPQKLKELYSIQNGGHLYDKLLTYGDKNFRVFWQEPLMPTQDWRTAFDHFQIYGEPDDPYYEALFINETRQMIVLLQDHQDILFLDYNRSGEPRVGFAMDPGDNDWYIHADWWPNISVFLASIRRYKVVETCP